MMTLTNEQPLPKRERCLICDEDLFTRGTQVDKVYRCRTCGAPYSDAGGKYHSMILSDWIEPTRNYWQDTKRNVAPGLGFPVDSNADGPEVDRDKLLILGWFRKHAKTMPASYATWGRAEDKRF